MPKRKKTNKSAKSRLDRVQRQELKNLARAAAKKKRGRPGVRASEIAGRSFNYRNIFEHIWPRLHEPLLRASTKEEVAQAFKKFGEPYSQEFVRQNELILRIIRESKFPKRPAPQIAFLADSLAGLGRISPRRSRDICERERKHPPHTIIRRDFYIECTCKYKGPALYGSCPKCGTSEVAWVNVGMGSIFRQNT